MEAREEKGKGKKGTREGGTIKQELNKTRTKQNKN